MTGLYAAAWTHFDLMLGLTVDLLPVVADQAVPISPNSKMKALGKTPSIINSQGRAAGIPKWTSLSATGGDVARWSADPRLGVCLQTRYVRAIDIDVEDPARADAIEAFLVARLGTMPCRFRGNSGKRLLAFVVEEPLFKRQFKGDCGLVEFLGAGQQFVVASMHPSGVPYEWRGGLPDDFPRLSPGVVDAALEAMREAFGMAELGRGAERRQGERLAADDPVADWLYGQGLVLDQADDRLYVDCPWKDGHSGDSGVTEAAWLVAGSNAYERGHFKCLHASCAARTDDDFLNAIGFTASDFEMLPAEETERRGFPIADLIAWHMTSAAPKRFIMPGFVPADEVTLATGAGGANKSTFGQQLATCCAAGAPMLGIELVQCATLYITAEDDEERLHWMQEHICRAVGVSLADLVKRLHLVSLRGRLGNELATFTNEGKLKPTAAFGDLKATIEATGARLVVLDNAAHLYTGDESNRQQVTAFVNLLYSLVRDLGVTIILVAHSNKAGDTYSGSTAWLNAVRSQVVLQRPENNPDPDARVLTLGKANYARQGAEIYFRWHDFALIREADLPESERVELAATAQAAADDKIFMNCLAERNRQKRAVSEKIGPNYAPAKFIAMPEARGTTKQRLETAMDRLFRTGRIRPGFLWRDSSKGRDVEGLIEVKADPQTVTPNAPQTSTPICPNPAENDPKHIFPYTTYRDGAALEAAAPST